MTKGEIRRKFDEIVAFAEIEKFIDTPVKRYSSGMYVRLAFGVAAHLDPEILIVDEVLAVGDAAFQKKCLGKMHDVSTQEGRTVLFVSHNMGAVSNLTQRCLFLENGKVAASGPSREIVEEYLMKSVETHDESKGDLEFYRRDHNPDSPVKITGINLSGYDQNSIGLPTIEIGAKFTIEIHLEVIKPLHEANVTVALKTAQGERAALLVSWDHSWGLSLEPGRHSVQAQVDDLSLSPGRYLVDVGIDPSMNAKAYDAVLDYPLLAVVNRGQVIHWTERPWGMVHCSAVKWGTVPSA
jgi:lipopolysaccharide transport system ATP-binding protein